MGFKEDGSDVISVYPLLPNGTCRFIVFDFDNHEKGAEATDFSNTDNEWHKEVDALRNMCELNGINPLVEKSRSGKGAHVWIFFKKAIPAATTRNFGFLLLDKGSAFINLKSFHYYDRMSIWTGEMQSKQMTNAIFDSGNYTEKFEQDIVEAEKIFGSGIRLSPIGPRLNLGYHKATKRGAADADYPYARLEEYDSG